MCGLCVAVCGLCLQAVWREGEAAEGRHGEDKGGAGGSEEGT